MKVNDLKNTIKKWYKDKYNLDRHITKVKDGIYIHTNMSYGKHSFKLFMSLDDFMEYPALSYNYLENADDDIIHIIEGDLV